MLSSVAVKAGRRLLASMGHCVHWRLLRLDIGQPSKVALRLRWSSWTVLGQCPR